MTRADALRLPHAEPLLNGRCVGQVFLDETTGGTCLRVVHCEHPDGAHVPWPEPGWDL